MKDPVDDEIVHREVDTDGEKPAVALADVVADLQGTSVPGLPPTDDCVDGLLSGLYSDPPAPEPQVSVEFTYGGYRFTVEQRGTAEFVHVT